VCRIPDEDTGKELDQRDGQADLDRDRRSEENRPREDGCNSDVAQLYLREARDR